MQNSAIEQYMAEVSELVASRLQSAIPAEWTVPETLGSSMKYSLMAGGKRLRPLLVVAAAEALGGSRDAALPVACAVEWCIRIR
ncbi:hypothetical protein HMSSN036_96930 [Paenibacillus macerans]|nr:hypothetical protein HMSSN036_96930 [Paenibacillus macerans]